MGPDAILQRLIQPFHPPTFVHSRVVECCADVVDPFPHQIRGQLMGDHLGAIVSCDLLGQAATCEQGVQDVDQHLGCDGAHRCHLWPLRVEVINHNGEPLVMRHLGWPIQWLHGWGWAGALVLPLRRQSQFPCRCLAITQCCNTAV